jgi:hypothetical protein
MHQDTEAACTTISERFSTMKGNTVTASTATSDRFSILDQEAITTFRATPDILSLAGSPHVPIEAGLSTLGGSGGEIQGAFIESAYCELI